MSKPNPTLRIGELAGRAGVRVDTVRYYEKRGLLPRPHRLPSGYRQFDADSLARLHFIRRAQQLGFSLDEIAELLRLHGDSTSRCSDVHDVALARRDDIDAKLADLTRMRAALDRLVECCDSNTRLEHCPLLECLPGGEFSAARQ